MVKKTLSKWNGVGAASVLLGSGHVCLVSSWADPPGRLTRNRVLLAFACYQVVHLCVRVCVCVLCCSLSLSPASTIPDPSVLRGSMLFLSCLIKVSS